MVDLILPKERIISLDDCRLCGECRNKIGTVGKKAAVIYKTGNEPAIDWIITLQRSNISHPERGFTLMLMPLGHLTAFSQVYSSRELAQNFGLTFALAHYGMQVVREERWKPEFGDFMPAIVCYGKCASAINTQEHIHIKAYTLDGNANQPLPSDTELIKREILTGEKWDKYVKAMPVVKGKLDEERYLGLAKRLIEICTNS